MARDVTAASPRALARLAGLLYLISIIVGIFDEAFVKARILVPGDAAATAANLRSMELLWRLGIVGELVMILATVVVAFALYILLRPVSRDLAVLMTFFQPDRDRRAGIVLVAARRDAVPAG